MAGLFGRARSAIQGRSLGDNLAIIGATLRDMSNPQGNAVAQQRAGMEQRAFTQHQMAQEALRAAAMDRLRSDVSPLDGPGGSGTGAARTPAEIQQALFQGAMNGLPVGGAIQAWQGMNPEPKIYNTTRGLVMATPDGNTRNIYEIPPEAPKASPGWNINPDGSWAPVQGGPYDPDYIRRSNEIRRQVMTSNPMPSRARGGGSSAPAIGRAPSSQSARRPWENYR